MMLNKSDVFKAKRFESRLMLAHYDKVMDKIDDLRLRAGKLRLGGINRQLQASRDKTVTATLQRCNKCGHLIIAMDGKCRCNEDNHS